MLALIAANFDRFFFESDRLLMPDEIGAILDPNTVFERSTTELSSWCRSESARARPTVKFAADRFLAMTPSQQPARRRV